MVAGLVLALAFVGSAIAATPVSPTDGQTLTTATPQFGVITNTSPSPDGAPFEQNIMVYVSTPSGASAGLCAAVYNAPTNTAYCTLASPLPNGVYTWHFTWGAQICVPTPPNSGGSGTSCSPALKTSPSYPFTVAVPGVATTTRPATTTTATTPTLTPYLDRSKPLVKSFARSLVRGKPGLVLFRASDNSGRASVVLSIGAAKLTVWQKVYRRAAVRAGVTYQAHWTPKRAGLYVLCVGAIDAANNSAKPSCSKITVTA